MFKFGDYCWGLLLIVGIEDASVEKAALFRGASISSGQIYCWLSGCKERMESWGGRGVVVMLKRKTRENQNKGGVFWELKVYQAGSIRLRKPELKSNGYKRMKIRRKEKR